MSWNTFSRRWHVGETLRSLGALLDMGLVVIELYWAVQDTAPRSYLHSCQWKTAEVGIRGQAVVSVIYLLCLAGWQCSVVY